MRRTHRTNESILIAASACFREASFLVFASRTANDLGCRSPSDLASSEVISDTCRGGAASCSSFFRLLQSLKSAESTAELGTPSLLALLALLVLLVLLSLLACLLAFVAFAGSRACLIVGLFVRLRACPVSGSGCSGCFLDAASMRLEPGEQGSGRCGVQDSRWKRGQACILSRSASFPCACGGSQL